MKSSGKPDVGNLQVRFEEGGGDGMGRAISTLLVNIRLSVVAVSVGNWPKKTRGAGIGTPRVVIQADPDGFRR